ncbi:hypothetical protein SEA_MASK_89 [Mycobacterium phage Mask]|nr:hypothetical protein SEA_SEJANUS_91 [Mycobacterium phage Sejanus]UVT31627.1 hypothetical protein SEA_MASK_89 [Mycobacterium phage Mask]
MTDNQRPRTPVISGGFPFRTGPRRLREAPEYCLARAGVSGGDLDWGVW